MSYPPTNPQAVSRALRLEKVTLDLRAVTPPDRFGDVLLYATDLSKRDDFTGDLVDAYEATYRRVIEGWLP